DTGADGTATPTTKDGQDGQDGQDCPASQSRTGHQDGAATQDGGATRDGPGEVTPEDLSRAGWSPQLIQALSALPPATLQVIVPLIGLHDPATAHTLPTLGRTSTHPTHVDHDPEHPAPTTPGEGHTGR